MIRNFPLYNLRWQDFEELVVLICEQILGTGTINFSSGPDGGRDAKFTGKAQNFPSKAKPWDGRFIIQAKHTEKSNAKCSDYDFKNLLENEVNNKLKPLVENKEVDYYLLFTNRKLSGLADAKISNFITTNLKIENRIIGDERIQLWLRKYPEIARILDLNRLFIPLQFDEKDLKEIIVKFSEIKEQLKETVKRKQDQLKFVDKTRKNELNNLSEEYFEFMKKESLAYFHKIEAFLKDPVNRKYKNYYDNTISDLQEIVIIRRKDYHQFEELFQELYKYIMAYDSGELRDNRRLVRIFLHYMYWHCDIGVGD
jgi:hypothetical protein